MQNIYAFFTLLPLIETISELLTASMLTAAERELLDATTPLPDMSIQHLKFDCINVVDLLYLSGFYVIFTEFDKDEFHTSTDTVFTTYTILSRQF